MISYNVNLGLRLKFCFVSKYAWISWTFPHLSCCVTITILLLFPCPSPTGCQTLLLLITLSSYWHVWYHFSYIITKKRLIPVNRSCSNVCYNISNSIKKMQYPRDCSSFTILPMISFPCLILQFRSAVHPSVSALSSSSPSSSSDVSPHRFVNLYLNASGASSTCGIGFLIFVGVRSKTECISLWLCNYKYIMAVCVCV